MQAAGDQAAVTGAAGPAAARQLGAAARRRTSTRATSSAGRAAGGWAATEPEEEEAETLHSLREVNKRGCIYKTDWCQDARRNHVLGLRIVQLSSIKEVAFQQMAAYNASQFDSAARLSDKEKGKIWGEVQSHTASSPDLGLQHPEFKSKGSKPGFAMLHYCADDREGTIKRMTLASVTRCERDQLGKSAVEKAALPPLPTRPYKGTGDGVMGSPHFCRGGSFSCSGCKQCSAEVVAAEKAAKDDATAARVAAIAAATAVRIAAKAAGVAAKAAAKRAAENQGQEEEPAAAVASQIDRAALASQQNDGADARSGVDRSAAEDQATMNRSISDDEDEVPTKNSTGGYKKARQSTKRRDSKAGRRARKFRLERPPERGYWCTTFEKLKEFHDQVFDEYREQSQHQALLNMQEALAEVQKSDTSISGPAAAALEAAFTKVSQNKNKTIKKIVLASKSMTRKGLAGRVVGMKKWRLERETTFSVARARTGAGDDIVWDSDELLPGIDGKSRERLINRLLALGIGISPVTFSHACMLLRACWFKVPWSTGMYEFIIQKVRPAIEQLVAEQEDQLVAENDNCDCGFDACHSAVRSAQSTRAALSLENKGKDQGKILKAIVYTKGKAAGREDTMLRALLAWKNEVGLTIKSVCTDESSGRSVVKRDKIESSVDMWHAKKNTRKNLEKFRSKASPRILSAIHKLAALFKARNKLLEAKHLFGNDEQVGYISLLQKSLEDNHAGKHEQYVSAANGFVDVGAWPAARAGADQMTELLTELQANIPPEPCAEAAVKDGVDRSAVLAAIVEVRKKKNFRRKTGADIEKGEKGWRNTEIADLEEWRVDDTPDPLADELKVIVQMHRDYSEDWSKLPIKDLRPKVLECLPTAIEAFSTFKLEDAVKAQEQWVEAQLAAAPAPLDVAEDRAKHATVLSRLEKEEEEGKAKRQHSTFVSLAEVQVEDLNSAQITMLMKHLDVDRPVGMDVETARLALSKKLPLNPVKVVERAIKRSIRLVKKRITSFANQYGHLVRIVNQLYGVSACKEWKSWWVTMGMLQFRKHCDGKDHCDCNRFLFYSRCEHLSKRPESGKDEELTKSWHERYTLSPGQPEGISSLAQLVLTMYTLEPKFQRRIMETIQFGRTNNLESFFHLVE